MEPTKSTDNRPSIEVHETSLYAIIEKLEDTQYIGELREIFSLKKDANGKIISITNNKKAFVWREWDITSDTKNHTPYHFEIRFNKVFFEKISFGEYSMVDSEKNIISTKSIMITESEFRHGISIYGCIFEKSFEIIGSMIQEHTEIQGTDFVGKANFSRTTFAGINMQGVDFMDTCSFVCSHFTNADATGNICGFQNIHFKDKLDLSGAVFDDYVNFTSIRFTRLVDMNGTRFIGAVKFDACLISGTVFFRMENAISENNFTLNLHDVREYRQLSFSFDHCNISLFSSYHSEIADILLQSDYRKTPFDRATEKILSNIYLYNLRILQNIYKSLNLHEANDICYLKIMREQNRQYLMQGGWRRTLGYFQYMRGKLLYDWVFGWGVRLRYPLLSSAIIMGAFSIPFYTTLFVDKLICDREFSAITQSMYSHLSPWHISAILSFQSFFSIIVPEKDMTKLGTTLGYLSTGEAILGTLFITTIVAILSRKFMRM